MGLRIGAMVGALVGAAVALMIGFAMVWLIVAGGALGGVAGYRHERHQIDRESKKESDAAQHGYGR
jgi:uncharacterized membrane protein